MITRMYIFGKCQDKVFTLDSMHNRRTRVESILKIRMTRILGQKDTIRLALLSTWYSRSYKSPADS